MSTIAYLTDNDVDGMAREWESHFSGLGDEFKIHQEMVNSYHPMPPSLAADAVVVQFTASWAKLPFLTLLQAQRPNRPLLLVEHVYGESFERLCVPNQPRFRMLLKLVYSLFDVVVCVSEAQARWMRASGVVPARKITVIRSALECRGLFDIAAPQPVGMRPLRLAALGPYSPKSGFDTLIEAMRQVPPEIATLRLAGTGVDGDDLKMAAASLSHVQVGDGVSDRAAFLANCDVVVVPSRWEPFGMVAAEAQAAARPLIVSDIDGLGEQVNRSTGIAVGADDARLLADAIIRMRGYDLNAMGLAARASVENHCQAHLDSYRRLLGTIMAGKCEQPAGAAALV